MEQFNRLVDSAIALNRYNRTIQPKEIINTVSTVNYLKEFATVRIDIGRRIGKTQYIMSRATSNDLVIVANSATERYLKNSHSRLINILSIQRLEYFLRTNGTNGSNSIVTLFIDEPSIVFNIISYSTILSIFSKSMISIDTIVILGV